MKKGYFNFINTIIDGIKKRKADSNAVGQI